MNDVAATIEKPPSSLYDLSDDVSRCVLCESPGYELHQEVTHYGFPFRFSRCHCGLIKQTPMPNEAFFEWFFNSDLFLSAKRARADQVWGFYDYLKDEPCRLATSRYRYQRLGDVFRPASVSSAHSRRSTSPLRIMKIGPSTGSMLHIAKEHGHDAFGCDVSTRFIEYARETYGVTIDHGRFERLQYPAESFDVILLFNVIENVPNLDEFLRSVHRALKPNGLFVLNYVDMRRNLIEKFQGSRYFIYRPPICYVFEGAVLARTLAKYGFAAEASYRDVRIMHLEKILTLLAWNRLLAMIRALGVHLVRFPIYAYPSRIVVARKDRQSAV
jgi:2-polyprenyl-3-methyl-5-hydroxy-6-metoxy-1,4-benzoquinol methylase